MAAAGSNFGNFGGSEPMGKSLMEMLDEARGHVGVYDETSYRLAAVAVEWAQDRVLAEGDRALFEGSRVPIGEGTFESVEPGVRAVAAMLGTP